jgi:antitoxin component YwqK of YwqJK toxin-antitoxin module
MRIDDKNRWFVCAAVVFFMLLNIFALQSRAQCVTFKLTDRGDTINCIDKKGVKQGPWLELFPELRGNPGYEEEGVYVNGIKEGVWRRFSLQGDILSVENYKWGLLNGKSAYYSLSGLEREESWWAIDPTKKYDTIDVPDLYVDGSFRKVIVPNEGRSMKHGTWNYYNPMTGRIESSQEYIRDSAVGVLGALGINQRTQNGKSNTDTSAPKKAEKPATVLEWEKKNSGKKKVVVRDGSTGY